MQNVRLPLFFYVLIVSLLLILLGTAPPKSQKANITHIPELRAVQQPRLTDGLLADPGSNEMFLPPRHTPGRATPTSTFHVNWNPSNCNGATAEWTPDAIAAFEYAVGIWETLIVSDVPITVDACWAILGSNVLGAASSTNIGRNYPEMPLQNTWYPIALLNSFVGSDKNGETAEVMANFNSEFSNWYFGTDGNPRFNQYDFVSVVLHEIGHGLGFAGSMAVSTEIGLFGYGNSGQYDPVVYDVFSENGSGDQLIHAFGNGSAELREQLVSGNLYFGGTHVLEANGGTPAKIYSPRNWSQGSSFSHLDTSFDNTGHALMTHSIANGEAIHDPGHITLALLKDLGWEITDGGSIAPSKPIPTPVPAPTATPTPSPEKPAETSDAMPYVDVVDNEQAKHDKGQPLEGAGSRWQRFIPTNEKLVSAEVWLEVEGGSTNVLVEISDSNDQSLGSGVIQGSTLKSGWNTVVFSTPIDLVPGRTYKLSVGYQNGVRAPSSSLVWKGGAAEVYCYSCSSDVSPRNFEYSYAFRTIGRTFLPQSIYMPVIR